MKEMIRSSTNSLVKEIRKLSRRKYRDEKDLFVVESKKLLDEAIKSNLDISHIFIREDEKNYYKDFNTQYIDAKLFNSISYLVSPDGYMAMVKKKEKNEISDRILILDSIQDPGNMGTLVRSAEAFGFNTILAIESVDFYNEKVLRASMGSLFRLNLIQEGYDYLKNLDHTLYLADMDGKDYRKVTYPDKLGLVISNEGQGVSKIIENLDHKRIKIPMQGRIESLNAGVSGAILMASMAK